MTDLLRSEPTREADLSDNVDGAGRDRTDMVNTDETHKLIDASKVAGTAVYNGAGDKLGTVERVMLNKFSGKVAFVVIGTGGVLGVGERYHPLHWDVLTYDDGRRGYNVDLPGDRLAKAAGYSSSELDTLSWSDEDALRSPYGVGA